MNIVGFYLNPTLLSKHPMAGELERVNKNDKLERKLRDDLVTHTTGPDKSAVLVDDQQDEDSQRADATTATPRRTNLSKDSESSEEKSGDTIDHCPNVEICLNTISMQEISPVMLVHDMDAPNPSNSPATTPASKLSMNNFKSSPQEPLSVVAEEEKEPPRRHRCQVGMSGIELVPSQNLARCVPLVTVGSTAIEAAFAKRARSCLSLATRIDSSTTTTEAPQLRVQRGRSYIVTSAGDVDAESQVDVESVAVSSLWSSGQDSDSETSYTGTFSSGSGLVEDDMLTNFTSEGGYPSNVYCFGFADKFDERDILCIGDDDDGY